MVTHAPHYLSWRAAPFKGNRGLHSVDQPGTPIIHFSVGDDDALNLVVGTADEILLTQ